MHGTAAGSLTIPKAQQRFMDNKRYHGNYNKDVYEQRISRAGRTRAPCDSPPAKARGRRTFRGSAPMRRRLLTTWTKFASPCCAAACGSGSTMPGASWTGAALDRVRARLGSLFHSFRQGSKLHPHSP